MSLPVKDQLKYWGVAAAVFLVLLYTLGNVILPFLVGSALAYFLDPVADRLQRLGLSRVWATALIAIGVLLALIALVVTVLPALFTQTSQLVVAAPTLIEQLRGIIDQTFPDLLDNTPTTQEWVTKLLEALRAKSGEIANTLIGSAMSMVSAILFFVIVPVVAFYMLLDWDRMIARIDQLLPRDHAPTIRSIAAEIDSVLAAFVRGQLTVCLMVGAFYSISLALAGLQFGFVVGVISGAITFIPYIGSIVGGVLAIGLALVQFWGDWFSIGLIVAIFALGQFLESNVITPRLVGNSVGLHPVWLLFALSAFGTLFGFVGMLVAVPVAAAIGVIVRYLSSRYTDSALYRGYDSP